MSQKLSYSLVRISSVSSRFSATAVFLYPPTDVLKIVRALGNMKENQKSSLISKGKVNEAELGADHMFFVLIVVVVVNVYCLLVILKLFGVNEPDE